FGDLADPDSDVSKSVVDRGGFNLLDEFGYEPVNKYLPPRSNEVSIGEVSVEAEVPQPDGSAIERLFAWADAALSR
ncbi:MAG: ferredoxin, partial [Pseudomonadota bacterium]